MFRSPQNFASQFAAIRPKLLSIIFRGSNVTITFPIFGPPERSTQHQQQSLFESLPHVPHLSPFGAAAWKCVIVVQLWYCCTAPCVAAPLVLALHTHNLCDMKTLCLFRINMNTFKKMWTLFRRCGFNGNCFTLRKCHRMPSRKRYMQ